MPDPVFFQSITEKYDQRTTILHEKKLLPFLKRLKKTTPANQEEQTQMLFSFYKSAFDLMGMMLYDYLRGGHKTKTLMEAYFYKMENYLFNSLHHISGQHQFVRPLRPFIRNCVEHLCSQSRMVRKRFEQDKEKQEYTERAIWLDKVGSHIASTGCCLGSSFLPDTFPELPDDDDFSEGAAYCQ